MTAATTEQAVVREAEGARLRGKVEGWVGAERGERL